MVISSDQIQNELMEIWPDYTWQFPKNPFWTAMPDSFLERAIAECSITHMQFIPHIWECENFSGRWQSNLWVFQYALWMSEEYKPEYRWYVSDVVGYIDDIFGGRIEHSQIIIRLESGWVLFDPQTDIVSKDLESFSPFYGDA